MVISLRYRSVILKIFSGRLQCPQNPQLLCWGVTGYFELSFYGLTLSFTIIYFWCKEVDFSRNSADFDSISLCFSLHFSVLERPFPRVKNQNFLGAQPRTPVNAPFGYKSSVLTIPNGQMVTALDL